jgi:hypothetical protein
VKVAYGVVDSIIKGFEPKGDENRRKFDLPIYATIIIPTMNRSKSTLWRVPMAIV